MLCCFCSIMATLLRLTWRFPRLRDKKYTQSVTRWGLHGIGQVICRTITNIYAKLSNHSHQEVSSDMGYLPLTCSWHGLHVMIPAACSAWPTTECWFVSHSGSLESMKPSDQQINVDSRTTGTTAYVKSSGSRQHTEHRAREQGVQNVSLSSPRSRGANQTTIKVPVKKPQQPTRGTGTTDPPFIGDTYMSEEIPPQTVSLLVAWNNWSENSSVLSEQLVVANIPKEELWDVCFRFSS